VVGDHLRADDRDFADRDFDPRLRGTVGAVSLPNSKEFDPQIAQIRERV
jgi:hypothetical protein